VGIAVSSACHLGASMKKWDLFRLEELEPSFKEFLDSLAMMRFGVYVN
jgi:hypothetical protein